MAINKRLAICITTYKRPGVLDDVLANIIERARVYNVPVYVNDNCSNDGTIDVLHKYKEQYEYFFPKVNSENIGFDRSFEDCLKRSSADYVWGMADYSFINEDALLRLIDIIDAASAGYDAIFLNNFSRVKCDFPCVMNKVEDVARKIGWHVSLLDSMVWSRRVIEAGRFERYYGSLFGYYGTMFEYLCNTSCSVLWVSESLVSYCHPQKQSLWLPKTINTWCGNWATMILSLPFSFALNEKISLIRSHSSKSGLFSLRGLLTLRRHEYIGISVLWRCRQELFLALPLSGVLKATLVSIMPAFLARWLFVFRNFFRKIFGRVSV